MGETMEPKKIFVISPIHKPDESGFDFTKLTLDEIIKPAAAEAGGYDIPVRADEIQSAGPITSQVIAAIVRSDICIADLTGRNPNVMYEVAIAHAANKPVILLQQEEGGGPFDFADERVIHYGTRADQASEARRQIVNQLRNTHRVEKDKLISETLGPVRKIFRDMKSSTAAGSPEDLIFNEVEKIKRALTELTYAIHSSSISPVDPLFNFPHLPKPVKNSRPSAETQFQLIRAAANSPVPQLARILSEHFARGYIDEFKAFELSMLLDNVNHAENETTRATLIARLLDEVENIPL